jgi:predicted AlkP superfamily pyrophosphatase or phosphodiesterase
MKLFDRRWGAVGLVAIAWVVLVAGCAAGAQVTPVATAVPHAFVQPPGPIQHVILITVDGLTPESYLHPDAHGLSVPMLRRMVQKGAYSQGVRSVFPSVTYPAHASIATGVTPARHGITSNYAEDPLDTNLDGWRWYAEDLQSAPLWDLAGRAGYQTALINWPVTVGAHATWLLPEYWRAKNAEDLKLLRALSTPELLQRVGRANPRFSAQVTLAGDRDQALVDIASYVLTTARPTLLMLHIADVDGAQHHYGLWSYQAQAAIETADRLLGRLFDDAAAAGIGDTTAMVVASDHGFANVTRMVRPGVLLREAGLITLNGHREIASWRAVVLSASGQCYVYLAHPEDAQTPIGAAVAQTFRARAGQPGGGIARLYDQAQIRAAGGDPRAFLALEAEPGTFFGPGYAGEYSAPAQIAATHGYDPERPEMAASLLMLGPHLPPGAIAGARLVDIAPTIAAWLALPMPDVDGRVLIRPTP